MSRVAAGGILYQFMLIKAPVSDIIPSALNDISAPPEALNAVSPEMLTSKPDMLRLASAEMLAVASDEIVTPAVPEILTSPSASISMFAGLFILMPEGERAILFEF